MKRSVATPLLLCIVLLSLAAVAAAVTPYPYGLMPSNAADADLTAAYSTWKTRHVMTATCGKRVDNGSNSTFSEGMGYGMVQLNLGQIERPLADQIIDSIESRLLALPDETRVLTGHGPATTIGAERKSNPFLRGR